MSEQCGWPSHFFTVLVGMQSRFSNTLGKQSDTEPNPIHYCVEYRLGMEVCECLLN